MERFSKQVMVVVALLALANVLQGCSRWGMPARHPDSTVCFSDSDCASRFGGEY